VRLQLQEALLKYESVRMELQDEILTNVGIVRDMTEENLRLRRSIGVCRLQMGQLKSSLTVGSDAYDAMVTTHRDICSF
jgi:hypothetical protein